MKQIRFAQTAMGFTLIEVTLAITIAAIALVSLVGMIPQGLKSMKLATDLAIEARIHQQIVAELTQTDWDNLWESHNQVWVFDDQGNEISVSQNFRDDERFAIVYSALVRIPRPGDDLPQKVGGGTYVPFDNSQFLGQKPFTSLRSFDGVQLILIEICTLPQDALESLRVWDDPKSERHINVYRATITRTQKF
ncbi:MAG: Verru_Chthon cassette protein B [Verrucomicrobiota bacterium]